jgi:hypothetical protein
LHHNARGRSPSMSRTIAPAVLLALVVVVLAVVFDSAGALVLTP